MTASLDTGPVMGQAFDDYFTNSKNCAVIKACKNNRLETVKWLYKNGEDIRAQHDAPIIVACNNGHLQIMEWLHLNGVDSTVRSNTHY